MIYLSRADLVLLLLSGKLTVPDKSKEYRDWWETSGGNKLLCSTPSALNHSVKKETRADNFMYAVMHHSFIKRPLAGFQFVLSTGRVGLNTVLQGGRRARLTEHSFQHNVTRP